MFKNLFRDKHLAQNSESNLFRSRQVIPQLMRHTLS